ncbi:MAG: hypothetical protein ACO32Z_02175 [Gemmatimonadaceae bacterium]|jgi:hypothetical protein
MFGCIGRIVSALVFLILGAVIHAQWPAIERALRERLPALRPAPVADQGRTIVAIEVMGDRVVVRARG